MDTLIQQDMVRMEAMGCHTVSRVMECPIWEGMECLTDILPISAVLHS
jgi:hypothetical protein